MLIPKYRLGLEFPAQSEHVWAKIIRVDDPWASDRLKHSHVQMVPLPNSTGFLRIETPNTDSVGKAYNASTS